MIHRWHSTPRRRHSSSSWRPSADPTSPRRRQQRRGRLARRSPCRRRSWSTTSGTSTRAACRRGLYRPNDDQGLGLLVYLHGGGWVIGDLDTHDDVCRVARQPQRASPCSASTTGSPPSTRSPRHSATPSRPPAGRTRTRPRSAASRSDGHRRRLRRGNLAAVVANIAPVPLRFQLLVYPVTDAREARPSHIDNARGTSSRAAGMAWFVGHYLAGGDGSEDDPRVSPLLARRRLLAARHRPGHHRRVRPAARRGRGLRRPARLAGVPTITCASAADPRLLSWAASSTTPAPPTRLAEHLRTALADRSGGSRSEQAARPASPGSELAARSKTASSIGSVRRPVNVFCWLGWNEHEQRPIRSAGGVGVVGRPTGHRPHLDAVAEPRPGPHARTRRTPPRSANAPRHTTTADPVEQRQLALQERTARVALGRQRLVGGRRALHRGRHPRAAQLQPVVGGHATSAGWPARPGASPGTASRPSGRR